MEKILILIPALNPNDNLINLIEELMNIGFSNIIIIDDGSSEENKNIFNYIKQNYKLNIYIHPKNLGKGEAIKTGLKSIDKSKIDGVITVDADGQHLAKDVKKVANKLLEGEIVLGERQLIHNSNVPMLSKIGNIFSSLYFWLKTGKFLEDTQTGLRGIPKKFLELALKTPGSRYEYESNFLEKIIKEKIKINVVNIDTVYENRIKNFRILKDSYIIYKEFLKNMFSSIIAAIIEIVLFDFLIKRNVSIVSSNICARIISGFLDFGINKLIVFKNSNSKNIFAELIKYIILFSVQMALNTVIILFLNNFFKDILLIKILVNIIMYITNFFIKRRFIFK